MHSPENFFLAFEVGIEGAERHTSPVGDAAYACLVESFLTEFDLGGFQQLVPGSPAAIRFRRLGIT